VLALFRQWQGSLLAWVVEMIDPDVAFDENGTP